MRGRDRDRDRDIDRDIDRDRDRDIEAIVRLLYFIQSPFTRYNLLYIYPGLCMYLIDLVINYAQNLLNNSIVCVCVCDIITGRWPQYRCEAGILHRFT